MKIQYIKFAVNENPFCVWDWDIAQKNLDFIKQLNPGYFSYIADKLAEDILTELDKQDYQKSQNAALVLRVTYSHALETFFAILCSALQVPNCIPGWLIKYKVSDIRNLLKKIRFNQSFYSVFELDTINFDSISRLIHRFQLEDTDKEDRIKSNFARLWNRFAFDFLDEKYSQEYNSIKHGFRATGGGFFTSFGLQSSPNIPAPPENMRPLGGSNYGSSYYYAEKISENTKNFRVRINSINWDPENYYYGLQLLSISILNLQSFLLIINNQDANEIKFNWPSEMESFELPWKKSVGVISMNIDKILKEEFITPFSKNDILSVYPQFK